jgi:hypothetical protein
MAVHEHSAALKEVLMEKSKLYIRTADGRELEILSGTYVYLRDAEVNGIYWLWQKIPVLHDDLNRIIDTAVQSIDQVKGRLGEIKDDPFPHE